MKLSAQRKVRSDLPADATHQALQAGKLKVRSCFSFFKSKISPLLPADATHQALQAGTSPLSLQKGFTQAPKLGAGFTLIELLVVIGILGILAAALVATIDPFEQLEKARDARVENTLVEYQTSNIRYYTNHGSFPFGGTDAGGGICPTAAGITGVPIYPTLSDCVDLIVEEGELKRAFTTATDSLSSIYLNYDTVNQDITICYQPTSKSKQRNENTTFLSDGGAGIDCKSTGGATNCYWCTR